MRPELIALIVNAVILLIYVFQSPHEIGKVLYWLGAVILTIGVLLMRG